VNFWNRFKRKQQQALPSPESEAEPGDLREFVYIDDVSVQSLLASRTGAIATDYTDSDTSGTKRTREANAGLKHGPLNVGGKTNREESSGTTAQVVRKSNAQARFKELLDAELEGLLLRATPPDALPSTAESSLGAQVVPPFEQMRDQHQRHLVAEADIRRGDLFELEIELEAEPIYGVSAAIASLIDLFEHAPEMVPQDDRDNIRQVSAVAKMLDQLLAGLVPVRGRAVDYNVLRRGDGDYVIHNSLVAQLHEEERAALQPLVVVGVAERDLFWKDIRRVLFAGHRYTVLARVAVDALPSFWQPIKLVDLVKQVSPELADMLGSASTEMLATLGDATEVSRTEGASTQSQRAFDQYRDLLAEEVGVEPAEAESRCQALPRSEAPLDREAFRDAAQQVTALLVPVPEHAPSPERLSKLRNEAWLNSLDPEEPRHAPRASGPVASERYLNAEFVAIYW
jgi:hypothetical protein